MRCFKCGKKIRLNQCVCGISLIEHRTSFMYRLGDKTKSEINKILLGNKDNTEMDSMTHIKGHLESDICSYNKPLDVGVQFFMPIEDAFTITGRGTVVVGKVLVGSFHVGAEAEIALNTGKTIQTTITGIEMYKRVLDMAQSDDNVGVFLRGVKKTDIEGSCALVNQNARVLHRSFKANIHLLSKEEGGILRPMFDHYYPFFRFGNLESRGMIDFKGVESTIGEGAYKMIMPGSDSDIIVKLDDNAIIIPGMSFEIHEGDDTMVARGKIIDILQ